MISEAGAETAKKLKIRQLLKRRKLANSERNFYWAIEKSDPDTKAFKLNNQDCTVFTEDCNLLKQAKTRVTQKNRDGNREGGRRDEKS